MPKLQPSSANEAAPAGTRLHLFPIVLLAESLRLAIIVVTLKAHPASWFFAQASELNELAHSLLTGRGLSSPFGGLTGPSAFLAPGYPLLVAGIFRIFQPQSFASAFALMLLQSLFATATIVCMMLLARKLFSNSTANLAGTVWAISPPLLFLPTIYWDTSFSIFLLTLLLTLCVYCAEAPSWRTRLSITLCALLMLYTNPSLATAITGSLIWTAVIIRRNSSRARPAAALASLALVLICFSFWPVRNYERLHAFIPLRSNMGYELWQGNRPGSDGFFSPALHPNVNQQEFQRYASLGEVAYMREKSSLAKSAISSDPARFLGLTAKRFFSFWSGLSRPSVWPMVAYASTTTLLGLLGLVFLFRSQKKIAILFAIPLVLLPLPYYVTHPDYRFRCVIDPVLTMLAAYALTRRNSSRHPSRATQ
jgi:4-amino-4-deoxy-L-arabinose transferase-like glycosyltransferase